IQSVSDIRLNRVPEEIGVGATQVLRIAKPELLVDSRLPKFGKQRWYFAQIIDIGQLTDQIGGTHKPRIVGGTVVLLILRNGKAGMFYVRFDFHRVDVNQTDLSEALAHEELRSSHVIGGERCVRRSMR